MASAIPNPFLSTGPKYTGPPMISCTYSGLTTYEQRLATYPASWYKNTRCPDPAVMAQAGLFRISSPDRIHLAGCSECDFGTAKWDKDPFVLHVETSPNCPLILRARKENHAAQAIAQSNQSSTPQVAPQAIVESISTPSIAELEAQAMLEAQAIIQSCTQLAQEAASQAANQMTAFEDDRVVACEEDLQVAIATPLPQAVECRRCLAGFSSNSKLHRHVRETHKKIASASESAVPQESGVSQLVQPETKVTARAEHSASKSVTPQKVNALRLTCSEITSALATEHSASESVVPQKSGTSQLVHSETEQITPAAAAISVAEHSGTKSIALPNCSVLTLASAEITFEATRVTAASASKSQPPFKYSASSLLTSETTSPAGETPLPASRPVTPPPTYRATSPPPPAYQPPKNYLTVADLYKRYSPLKSTCPAQKATASRAYLTVRDLYEKFDKRSPVKWTLKSSANNRAFDVKQSQIASQGSSKSMGRNAGKAMHSAMKYPATSTAGRIKSSASKSACDSKSSPIDFFRDSKSNVKTRFFTIANPNAQRLVTQQQRQTTPSFFASP